MSASQWDILSAELQGGVVRRSNQLIAAGVFPSTIAEALRRKEIVRPLVGTYHLARRAPRWKVDIAAACARLPRAVVCMETAARLIGLVPGFRSPLWLGVPGGLHGNVLEPLSHRLLCWSWRGAFTLGVVEIDVLGVEVLVTGPARTVIDLYRYVRHLDVDGHGATTLRRFMKAGGNGDELLNMAETARMPEDSFRRLRDTFHAIQRQSRRTHVQYEKLFSRRTASVQR